MNKFLKNLLITIALTGTLSVPSVSYAQFAGQQTWAGTAGGTANSITLPVSNVANISDLVGVRINFIVASANTTSATLVVGGTAPTSIKKTTATGLGALTGGEFQPGNVVSVIYDGTEYVINSPIASTTAPSTSQTIQLFVSGGTYTPSTGIKGVYVQCWAGGAGGGGGVAGGGGGGGEYRSGAFSPPGSPVSITIGSGGSGGAIGVDGNNGGNTVFGSLMTAVGGSGGHHGTSGSGGAGGAGGTGGSSNVAGSSGGLGLVGTNAGEYGGVGGSSMFSGSSSINIGFHGGAGIDGTFPGGGASGSSTSGSGNNGAGGACLVQELL